MFLLLPLLPHSPFPKTLYIHFRESLATVIVCDTQQSRYGREDEELMGLRFCNEILMAAEQIYPGAAKDARRGRHAGGEGGRRTTEQVRVPELYNAQGFMALPFVLDMGAGASAPPSVRLLPCRPYSGAVIGRSLARRRHPPSFNRTPSFSPFFFSAKERRTRSNCSPG